MITDAEKQLALESDRLRTDPAFETAIKQIRADAMEELAGADATQTQEIQRLQAEVRAVDRLCGAIAAAILKAREPRNVVGTPAD